MTQVIIDAGAVAAALIAILTFFGLVIRWVIVKPIQAYIDKATYQIQPHANGGKSLPDAVKAITEIKGHLEALDGRIEAIEAKVCKEPSSRRKKASESSLKPEKYVSRF